MGEQIYGLANLLNFNVKDQFIKWGKYTIAIDSISVFSTGVSTKYTRKEKEKSGFGKALEVFGAAMVVAAQMADEDISDKAETVGAAFSLYGSDSTLPCMNLNLSNGVMMEITFTDLMTFRDNVKAVKQAIADNAKRKSLEVNGKNVIVEGADFYGEAHFIEGGKE